MPNPSETMMFQGRYSDGAAEHSVPVSVHLTDRGVEISFAGASQPLRWPYGALGSATPVAADAGDVLLTYSYMPAASVFVAGANFVAAIAKAAPHITAGAVRRRAARPWMIAAASLLLIGVGVWLTNLSPARTLAGMLPSHIRVSLGEQVVRSMGDGRKECTTTAGRAALDRLVARLSAAAGSKEPMTVKVLDWDLVNAFAAPGAQIVLTRGIIAQAMSADEIAGVLAHEMGHALELHPETGIVRAIGLTAAVELLTGGSGTIANLGLMLTQVSYTRAAEREADTRGLAMLQGAEIATAGVSDFFRRVAAEEKKAGAPEWNILRTHPNPEERAKAALGRPAYRSTPAMTAEDWQALRGICGSTRSRTMPPVRPAN